MSAGRTAAVPGLQTLEAAGVNVADIALRPPTLDEVFLELTGTPAPVPSPAGRPQSAAAR